MKKITSLLCLIYLGSTKSSINSNLEDNAIKDILNINYKQNKYDGKVVTPMVDMKNNKIHDTMKNQWHRKSMLNYLKSLQGRRSRKTNSDSDTSSSSIEMVQWKDAWKDHWLQKKIEAINSSVPRGDTVNMVAARPWGLSCGDPNQHDAPWGTCMLPVECEPEYRIYRGDYFCGRTMFICCAIHLTNYDLYGGFDLSFDDSNMATDTEEKKNNDKGSKEKKRRKKLREKKRRRRERMKRKRKLKRSIRKIIRQLSKILNRSFRNGTRARKRKTKQLKKFIKDLKDKYKKDRKTVKDIHEIEMVKVDAALQKRLEEIQNMNQQFAYNETFRDIVINGTINRGKLRQLVKTYPELESMISMRRAGLGEDDLEAGEKDRDYLDYDIEYGYLYYD